MKKLKDIAVMTMISLTAAALPGTAEAAGTPSEAEFKSIERTYRLLPDGSQEVRVRKVLAIYSHTAMNSLYGETFIPYDPEYQEVQINESFTEQKDGTIIRTPDNAFVKALPAAAADAPAYNRLLELIVVHTGLDLGSTITLDYTIKTRKEYLPELDIQYEIRELSPVRRFTCTVEVPAGKELSYELRNVMAKPAIRTSDGVKTLSFTLKNVPASPKTYPSYNPFMAPLQRVASGMMPVFSATTFPSDAAALDFLAASFTCGDRAAVQARAAEITAGCTDDPSKARAIKQFMNPYYSKSGLSALTLENTGFRIRPASEILKTAYGTRAELANLENCLMRAAGLRSNVVFYFLKPQKNTVSGLSSLLYIAPENGYDAFGPAGEDKNLALFKAMDKYVSARNLEGSAVAPEAMAPVVINNERKLPGGSGTYKVSTLSNCASVEKLFAYAPATTCTENILLPYSLDLTINDCCLLEPGAQTVQPQDLKLENPVGSTTFTYSKEGSTLKVTRTLKINRQLITPSTYRHFRALLVEWMDTNRRRIAVRQ